MLHVLSPHVSGGEKFHDLLENGRCGELVLEDFINAAGSSNGAIDNRIEQAMDLVKSHLMNAVRSEVEELRERIIQLEESMRRLQAENEFWRSIATPAQMIQMEEHMQRLGFPPSIDYARQQQLQQQQQQQVVQLQQQQQQAQHQIVSNMAQQQQQHIMQQQPQLQNPSQQQLQNPTQQQAPQQLPQQVLPQQQQIQSGQQGQQQSQQQPPAPH